MVAALPDAAGFFRRLRGAATAAGSHTAGNKISCPIATLGLVLALVVVSALLASERQQKQCKQTCSPPLTT